VRGWTAGEIQIPITFRKRWVEGFGGPMGRKPRHLCTCAEVGKGGGNGRIVNFEFWILNRRWGGRRFRVFGFLFLVGERRICLGLIDGEWF